MFGGNPVGTNPEITSQLSGKNPKHINFIKPEAGMRINESGELIDPWGTPYFFHQLSGADMEIHSAGPDKDHVDLRRFGGVGMKLLLADAAFAGADELDQMLDFRQRGQFAFDFRQRIGDGQPFAE